MGVTSLADIDARWMTHALDDAGLTGGAHVTEMVARSIGTGQVGQNVRFALSWSGGEPDGAEVPAMRPASVVGKFPSSDPVSLQAAAATLTYVREVGFYRDLQPELPVPTPTVHRLEEDLDANRFLLLMEDVDWAEQGDQLVGCDVDRAALALDAVADLHAATWARDGELAELSWIEQPGEDSIGRLVGLYRSVFAGFDDRYRDRLSTDERELGRWLGERLGTISAEVLAGPRCLVHGDYRLDNLLFATRPGPRPITVVDWQTAQLGSGPSDAAYFVGAGLTPDDRRTNEAALVDRYHHRLVTNGVDIDREALDHRYRLGTASGYVMAVVASQIVGRTERGDDMFVAMASRHADQMAAAGLPDLIG